MQKLAKHPLDIPPFLLAVNRGKAKKSAKTIAPSAPKPEADPFSDLGIEPDTETLLRNEIRSGRFRRHWLNDPTTILVFEREHQLRKAKKEDKAEDREVEKKLKRNERLAAKALMPEFGAGIRIIVLNRNPKRQAGAARIPRFASLLEYLAKNPNASVAEVLRDTLYIKSDFLRDDRLKIIKTDLLPQQAKKGK